MNTGGTFSKKEQKEWNALKKKETKKVESKK